jgi:hypothetical protein
MGSQKAMPYVGTLARARETGGRLTFRDRLALTKLAAASLFSELPDLVTYSW